MNIVGHFHTSRFSTTRRLGRIPQDVCPLGARRIALTDVARVNAAYVWGDGEPGVLALHGWGSDSSAMHGLAAQARADGAATVCFDAPGHGVSPGSQATLMEYSTAAAAVLRRNPGVHTVVTHSLGAIAAVAAVAAVDPPAVRTILMLAPACTLGGVLERWATERGLSRRPIAAMYRELHRRNGVPVSHWDIRTLGLPDSVEVRMLHDPADDWTPIAESRAIAAAAPRASLREVAGVGHHGILGCPPAREALSRCVRAPADQEATGA
ncbi:alpha/beta hydrolase [Nocardia sp. NPDC050712]|uniref:alpha/beta fold hydrolase n=1 Tax=Nocardia sp. NPDC050712 TaxID=3155518 RepID=UPI0033D51CB9